LKGGQYFIFENVMLLEWNNILKKYNQLIFLQFKYVINNYFILFCAIDAHAAVSVR